MVINFFPPQKSNFLLFCVLVLPRISYRLQILIKNRYKAVENVLFFLFSICVIDIRVYLERCNGINAGKI
jgi:hypothetical protein